MPKLSVWNSGRKSNNYKYLDRQIAQYFSIGGTGVFVHKYIGQYDQDGNPVGNETTIQDMLFLENRDRRYAEDVIELRGIYNVQDNEFDLRQFGLFLANDDLFINFHINYMIEQVGRKLMNGDILELPHLRDNALLDENKLAANRYYVITDTNTASEGFSATWFPHVYRVKCTPLTDSQEFEDVTKKHAVKDIFGLTTGNNLIDIIGTIGKEQQINDAVVEEAKTYVAARNFETRQFFVIPGDEKTSQNPWIFAGDGDPPNGAMTTGSGNSFPLMPSEGDYFLRTDYEPAMLFRREGSSWSRQELDFRKQDWSMAHRVLHDFINNSKLETHDDHSVKQQKQPLSKAIKPRTDF